MIRMYPMGNIRFSFLTGSMQGLKKQTLPPFTYPARGTPGAGSFIKKNAADKHHGSRKGGTREWNTGTKSSTISPRRTR